MVVQMYRTLRVAESDKGVLSVVIDAPPMNLIGPELVRDLVRLLGEVESGQDVRVMVLESVDPEYFVPHVDLTKVAEYTAEAAKAGGPDDASLGMLWHKLSELPVVSIAKLRGRARGAGSELALACDMRFAARENAILGQIEVGVGTTPGAGGVQHLARLLGRGRAMEAILGADDFERRAGRTVRLDQPGAAGRRPGRVRGPARAAHRVVPRRRGAICQARAQRADHARTRTRSAPTPGGSASWSPRTRPRAARPPCSRRACRPVARSNSTSATASEPCDRSSAGSARSRQDSKISGRVPPWW